MQLILPQGRERPETWKPADKLGDDEAVDQFIRRKKSFPYCGRLIAMPSNRDPMTGNRSQRTWDYPIETSVDFPAMPDSIELARQAEYYVWNNMLMPDGVHQYKYTAPLVIPFSFRLHAFDEEFCPEGALTLLKLGARLHAFILPINTNKEDVTLEAEVPSAQVEPSKNDKDKEAQAEANQGLGIAGQGKDRIFNPVTLRLEIIFTTNDGPGIACTGYVKSVNVKFNGPWLRGPDESTNLPSSGDFSFEFVHRPGHYNTLGFEYAHNTGKSSKYLGKQPQAYAHVVKQFLFNTRHLSKVGSYTGFR